MSKKVPIGVKPVNKAADAWVESSREKPEDEVPAPKHVPAPAIQVDEPVEEMKRLTIDIPLSLHRAIKTQCSMRGTKIADEVREILSQKYGKS